MWSQLPEGSAQAVTTLGTTPPGWWTQGLWPKGSPPPWGYGFPLSTAPEDKV